MSNSKDSNNAKDVLVELSAEDIKILSKIYSQQDEAPHIYSFLETMLKWGRNPDGIGVSQVFVPSGDDWKKNGTFVAIQHFALKMIITYTLEESGKILRKVLATTKRFDFVKDLNVFYALYEKHIPIVDQAMASRGLKKSIEDKTELWRLNRDNADFSFRPIPDEYFMAELNISDSIKVNSFWPHRFDGSDEYIRKLIALNGGLGIYIKENKELVAWVLKSQLGQLALLQVVEEHMRKGLAQALILSASKQIIEEGFHSLATILVTNVASQSLFTKCGFKKQYVCAFTFINQN